MSAPTAPRPNAEEPNESPTSATARWQLWILTVWHPALGLAIDPVAVLALDSDPAAAPRQHVVWVPLVYDEAAPWHNRLAEGVTPERIELWEAEAGVCQMAATAVPAGAQDLRHAAELVLDELLAEVIPLLPPRGVI
jgi:hypothetical protein